MVRVRGRAGPRVTSSSNSSPVDEVFGAERENAAPAPRLRKFEEEKADLCNRLITTTIESALLLPATAGKHKLAKNTGRFRNLLFRGSSLLKLKALSLIAFALVLSLGAVRAYRYPEYSNDGLSYMANAVAMRGASVEQIHDIVYRAAKAGIPAPAFDHLTGNDTNAPAMENESFRDRATNPYHFAEFLPCFAIRPIFTELVYVLHYWFGVGLLSSIVLIPAASYWLMGCVVLAWLSRYLATEMAVLLSVALMLTPPLWDMPRSTTPDSLSALIVLSAAFLLFEQRKLLPGLILLNASVYVRTDNVILVLLVLAYLSLAESDLRVSHAVVLSLVAIGSVALINHFAGDYGPKMLYYRIENTPTAIGEFVPSYNIHDYLRDLRMGIAGALHGHYIPFLLMGLVGLLRRRSRAIVGLTIITFVYTAAHLVIYPVPETRYFGLFFAVMGIATASAVSVNKGREQTLAAYPIVSRKHSRLIQAVTAIVR